LILIKSHVNICHDNVAKSAVAECISVHSAVKYAVPTTAIYWPVVIRDAVADVNTGPAL